MCSSQYSWSFLRNTSTRLFLAHVANQVFSIYILRGIISFTGYSSASFPEFSSWDLVCLLREWNWTIIVINMIRFGHCTVMLHLTCAKRILLWEMIILPAAIFAGDLIIWVEVEITHFVHYGDVLAYLDGGTQRLFANKNHCAVRRRLAWIPTRANSRDSRQIANWRWYKWLKFWETSIAAYSGDSRWSPAHQILDLSLTLWNHSSFTIYLLCLDLPILSRSLY